MNIQGRDGMVPFVGQQEPTTLASEPVMRPRQEGNWRKAGAEGSIPSRSTNAPAHDTLKNYQWALVQRMGSRPEFITEAIRGPQHCHWFLSTEEHDALCDLEDEAANLLDAGGLTPTREAEVTAALTAIGHRLQLLDKGVA